MKVDEFKNGSTVRDKITGYAGIVIATTTYLNNCVRVGVQTTDLDKDGKPVEAQWFDIEQLEVVDKVKPMVTEKAQTGGPSRQGDSGRAMDHR